VSNAVIFIFTFFHAVGINPLPPSMQFGKKMKKLDLFSSVLSQFKKYHPTENLAFNNLGILQSFK